MVVTGGSAAGVFKENVIAPDGRHYLCGNNIRTTTGSISARSTPR